jgi:GNAT superfamily N-acetyltransferase
MPRSLVSEIQLRELKPDDLELVRSLYHATKDRLRPIDYDRWRLYGTPWGDSPAAIAVDGDVCAGLYIIWPVTLRLGSEDVLGAQSMDTMTHPDHRGRGLFTRLAEECFSIAERRGFEVVYGFPNENSYPGFVRRLNFDHAGDVPTWIHTPGRFGRRRSTDVEPLRDLAELAPLIEEFLSEKDVCRVRKDDTWLRWRYEQRSGEDYEWAVVRDSDGDVGAAALIGERDTSWGQFGRGDLRVHELFGRDEDALTEVLIAVASRARERKARSLRMLAHSPALEPSLRKAGFREGKGLPFIVRKLTARPLSGNVHHFPSWRIVGGDMDSF